MAEPTGPQPSIRIRAGHPDFLDLDWSRSIADWDHPRLMDLPKGISRHEVRFVGYDEGIYAIKELPRTPGQREWEMLRALEEREGPVVRPVGYVERLGVDPRDEWSTAVLTRYLNHSFSYRELLSGAGFGARRNQMLDAFAGLLVELHLLGCYWGDCSLSNVLYRFDADAIEATMVDAETAEIRDQGLSPGQREHDLEIMIENVAGGMADIAAAQGRDLDEADFALGDDIADRYRALWDELSVVDVVGPTERYKITERVRRLNDLGFEVDDVEITPSDGGHQLRFKVRVIGRNFHTNRLKELTGIEASERQAFQILSDLNYFEAVHGAASRAEKAVGAIRWRVGVFETWMRRLAGIPEIGDPVQAYCDLLYHRYIMSEGAGVDVGTEAAFEDWLGRGRPGYPLSE